MYLSLTTVLDYLKASPSSRCFIEGEKIVNSKHLVMCGIKKVVDEKWTINALCVQSSGIKSAPHEISGVLTVSNSVVPQNFNCTCKAGASGSCKHISATLIFCTRLYCDMCIKKANLPLAILHNATTQFYFKCPPAAVCFVLRAAIEELEKLSCTDTECAWKLKKTRVEKKYEAQPLHMTNCFKAMHKEPIVNLSTEEIEGLFNQARVAMPDSEFSLLLKGRRQIIETAPATSQPHIDIIFENAIRSPFLSSLSINGIDALNNCCKDVLKSLACHNVQEAMCYEQGTQEWKMQRRGRITGSTCYSVFTFKKTDWSTKLQNFFNSKNVKTKEMKHGLEQEALALSVFQKNNPAFKIQKVGIYISKLYPWLAYSPDGVIFCAEVPQRLLEIKCPYLGKIKSGMEVISTLPYINKKDQSLKENHSYYAQIQLGMALLNLNYCDFIVFFSKDQSYLHIEVSFNASYAKKLLETVSRKYFDNMIHYVCQAKI